MRLTDDNVNCGRALAHERRCGNVNMKIADELRRIEKSETVKILMAVESGSRAWGFASPDSDYDVRFLYKRPAAEYLRLEKTRDVIELPISDALDINGWDLSKALRLMHHSNPALLEWIGSPVRYIDTDFTKWLSTLAAKYFMPKSGIYHYLNMAAGTYKRHLERDQVVLKKYFYVIRPILACKWILGNGTPPPVPFRKLVDSQLDNQYKSIVDELLEIKVHSPEVKEIAKVEPLDRYIQKSLCEIEDAVSRMPTQVKNGWEALNAAFREEIYADQGVLGLS